MQCKLCLVEKGESDFSKGNKSVCNPCRIERMRVYNKAHREQAKVYMLRWALKKNPGYKPRDPALTAARLQRSEALRVEREAKAAWLAKHFPNGAKHCKDCRTYMAPELVSNDRICKPCRKLRTAAFKRNRPEKYKATKKSRRKRHKHATRARKHGPGAGSYTEAQWQHILTVNDHKCVRCGSPSDLTIDHRIPLSLGGTNDWTNLQPLCHMCNSRKGATVTGAVQAFLPGMLTIA